MVISEEFAEVWERTLQSGQADLPPEAARYFLKMRFADADQQRMNALAAKAQEGNLTENEESDLANYMQMGWFLDLVKSKARLSVAVPPRNN
jgi:hypothetical protein